MKANWTQAEIDWRSVAEAVKHRLTVPEVFRALGGKIRDSKRADCLLCRGSSHGTVAYKEHVWYCHRCNAKGDVISLVEAVHHCNFVTALKWLAELGNVPLPTRMTPTERQRFRVEKRERQRISRAALKLTGAERVLRLAYRDSIHRAEWRQRSVTTRLAELRDGSPEHYSGEGELCWTALAALWTPLQEALAAYSLLSFGSALDRATFVLKPEMRPDMIERVRWLGGVRDDETFRETIL